MILKNFKESFLDSIISEQEEQEVNTRPDLTNKIGKPISYFNNDDNKFIVVRTSDGWGSDGFTVGEDDFLLDKSEKITFGETDVYKAINVDYKKFYIFIDKSGNLYTDQDDKVGLYKKILK